MRTILLSLYQWKRLKIGMIAPPHGKEQILVGEDHAFGVLRVMPLVESLGGRELALDSFFHSFIKTHLVTLNQYLSVTGGTARTVAAGVITA